MLLTSLRCVKVCVIVGMACGKGQFVPEGMKIDADGVRVLYYLTEHIELLIKLSCLFALIEF